MKSLGDGPVLLSLQLDFSIDVYALCGIRSVLLGIRTWSVPFGLSLVTVGLSTVIFGFPMDYKESFYVGVFG